MIFFCTFMKLLDEKLGGKWGEEREENENEVNIFFFFFFFLPFVF